MPAEAIATPPPAVPATPPPATPPAAPPATPPPEAPPAPAAPRHEAIDDDPNVKLAQMGSKIRDRKGKTGAEGEQPTTEEAAKNLTNLFGKALGFTQKKAETPPVTPPAAAKADDPPPATPPPAAPPAEPPPAAPAKGKKKVAQPHIDAAQITQAATAAATAAVKAMHPGKVEVKDPLDDLAPQDRRNYEVAAHLATIDPKYKDAPRLVLEHVKKAEEYANNWEQANRGKVFDPNDDEHNDFFAQLETPWSPEEFQDAAADLKAEKKLSKIREEQSGELEVLRRDQARIELAPVVDNRLAQASVSLAEKVGTEFHEALNKGGWQGLNDHDPITAKVMAVTMQQMHPFIEAAIQIDDPKSRFKIDPKNPTHQQWNRVVTTGEAELQGVEMDGRTFARRSDYVKMSPAEQANHWFLTTEMIIQGAVDYAAEQVKSVAEAHKKELEQYGFVRAPKAPKAPASGTPPSTPPPAAPTPPAAPPADKPQSPSASPGAKIDHPPEGKVTGNAQIMQEFRRILHMK